MFKLKAEGSNCYNRAPNIYQTYGNIESILTQLAAAISDASTIKGRTKRQECPKVSGFTIIKQTNLGLITNCF